MTLAATLELLEPANLARTRDALASAHHLGGTFYTSPDIQALEKERIFMKDWLFLARVEEFPNPGDYLAVRIAGEPVVIVRDESGEINAHANVCRHRGVEVAPLGSGSVTSFMCPYHAWTYGLDGKLISAPGMNDSSVDLTDCRLPPLQTEIWQGFVFVTLNPEPEPFSQIAAALDRKLDFARFENCRVARKSFYEFRCNWKFAAENLFDFYHVKAIHGDSFGKHYKSEPDYDRYNYMPDGGFSIQWEAGPQSRDGKSLIGPMPWFDGRPNLAYYGLQFPNFIVSGRCDMSMVWTGWPITPDSCQFVLHPMVAEEALAKPEFEPWLDDFEAFLDEIIDEDRAMIESLQTGAGSRMFEPGLLAKAEGQIHHYLNAYLDRMQSPAAS